MRIAVAVAAHPRTDAQKGTQWREGPLKLCSPLPVKLRVDVGHRVEEHLVQVEADVACLVDDARAAAAQLLCLPEKLDASAHTLDELVAPALGKRGVVQQAHVGRQGGDVVEDRASRRLGG